MGYKVLGKVQDSTETTAKTGYKVLGQAKDYLEDDSGTGGGFLQSAKDTALQALDTGGEIVSEVADTVYQALPEKEDVKETLSDVGSFVGEAVSQTSEAIESAVSPESVTKGLMYAAPVASKILPINASKFSEFLSNKGKISITEEDLGNDYGFLREKAIEAIQSNKGKFDYSTWGFDDRKILMSDLKTTAAKSFTDPNYRMATLIGRTGDNNVRIEDGRVIVEDVYDFNSGPRGRKLQQALVLKETGDTEGYERLAGEALDELPYFGQMRVWAAALGVPQGEGTRFKLDLGPAPEGM